VFGVNKSPTLRGEAKRPYHLVPRPKGPDEGHRTLTVKNMSLTSLTCVPIGGNLDKTIHFLGLKALRVSRKPLCCASPFPATISKLALLRLVAVPEIRQMSYISDTTCWRWSRSNTPQGPSHFGVLTRPAMSRCMIFSQVEAFLC
jgi:hypothetical protein